METLKEMINIICIEADLLKASDLSNDKKIEIAECIQKIMTILSEEINKDN